jgi:N-acetyl-S-(2-succino)cysteine monooxygenase
MAVRQLHLNAFLTSLGHHESAWRMPAGDPPTTGDVGHYRYLAQVAERGLFDSVFLGDSPPLQGDIRYRAGGRLDPTVLLAALATATQRIGLVATASTTHSDPYTLARRFATLELISGGRAGWNIVTTDRRDAGPDDVPARRYRYERAAEFVDVCVKLWESWSPDRPLLVHGGSSDEGREFAAGYAEAIVTSRHSLADAQAIYLDLKKRAAALGRDPDLVAVLPAITPIIGATPDQAAERREQLAPLLVNASGLRRLSETVGLRLTADDLDRLLPETAGAVGGGQDIAAVARREGLTVRGLLVRLGGDHAHPVVTGTPEQIADTVEEWFAAEAADGFTVVPALLPSGLELFVDHVVPVLQRRGLFRTAYSAGTLRGHYGLGPP